MNKDVTTVSSNFKPVVIVTCSIVMLEVHYHFCVCRTFLSFSFFTLSDALYVLTLSCYFGSVVGGHRERNELGSNQLLYH